MVSNAMKLKYDFHHELMNTITLSNNEYFITKIHKQHQNFISIKFLRSILQKIIHCYFSIFHRQLKITSKFLIEQGLFMLD